MSVSAGGQPFNVQQASANGLQASMDTSGMGTMYQAPTLAGANLGAYQNPYQQTVIDNTLGTMNDAYQMTQNMNGAQATSAGAFGGSRHGLVESETNREFMDATGNMAAQLNQQGYNNSQNAAMYDINNNMASQNMRMGAAGQLGGLSGQAFGTAQAINNDLASAGLQQQAVQQQLIDAQRAQYAGYTNAPQTALTLPLAALGATPNVGSQETSQDPGLFNYLSLGLGLL